MNPDIFIFENPQELAEALAWQWEKAVLSVSGKSLSIAVSGGAAPRAVFDRLAKPPFQNKVPWESVHLFWADERCVAPNHEDSNFGTARQILIDHISIPGNHVHRICGEEAPDLEVKRYEGEIKGYFAENGAAGFDWVQLGVGVDGHTASLFPGFHFNDSDICSIATHPQSGQKRITLTLKTINRSARISFIATGKEKAPVISAILNKKPESKLYPATHVKPENGKIQWFLDKQAAALL